MRSPTPARAENAPSRSPKSPVARTCSSTAFAAWTEPTPWIARPYGVVDRRAVDGLARLLRRTDLEPAVRCQLLASYVTELSGEGDPRSARAASEAVELARGLGDPSLLAMALFEQARDLRWDQDPGRRALLADEMEQIATEHHLTAYGWRAQYIAATAAAAGAMSRPCASYIDCGLQTARQYQMAEPLAVGLSAQGMLAHIAGHFDEAERSYAEVAAQLARSRSPHAAGFRGARDGHGPGEPGTDRRVRSGRGEADRRVRFGGGRRCRGRAGRGR